MANVEIKLTEFSDLITRYTADFVGREWLVEQVNALLDDPECRFVVLTGGPGVGKTAFLAPLAARHPQRFCPLADRDRAHRQRSECDCCLGSSLEM